MVDVRCRAARAHFSELLDGEPLPLFSRAVARLHLTVCPRCRNTWLALVATRDALRALRDSPGPAGEQ
jgi:predicted anti-sigma-YlaC factor YlaD